MHMGVFEWCLDDYAPYKTGPQTDPVTLDKGSRRKVARGGDNGYGQNPNSHRETLTDPAEIRRYIRSASRGNFSASIPYPIIGLRPVLAPAIQIPKPQIPKDESLEPIGTSED